MEMDGERIGMVLVRASELHSKIASCIHKSNHIDPDNNNVNDGNNSCLVEKSNGEEEDEDALLNICDAFDALESHLSSLQALQQQQQYEREAVIRDIENNRKLLLKKLSVYKGEHLDVIREAEAFASMKVERDSELLLPPYPTRAPSSLVLDNGHLSRFSNGRKVVQNGHDESEKSQTQSRSSKLWGGLRFLVHSTAKTMITIVGVITILSLAGFEPKLKKKGTNLKPLTLFEQPNSEQKRLVARCPPGKVAVLEDGEIRCIVKERVEIPFDSVAADRDVNYGCG